MSTVAVKPVKRSKRQLMDRRIQPAVLRDNNLILDPDSKETINNHFDSKYLASHVIGLTTAGFVLLGFATSMVASLTIVPDPGSFQSWMAIAMASPVAIVPSAAGAVKIFMDYKKKNYAVEKYGEKVRIWLSEVYDISVSHKDLRKATSAIFRNNKSFILTDLNSGEKFKTSSGRQLRTVDGILIKPRTPNALLKANSGIKESKPVLQIEAANTPKIEAATAVQYKLDILLQIPLPAEKQYVVEKAFKDFQHTVTIASRLKLLEDPRWDENLKDSLAVIDAQLTQVIEEERENTYQESLSATRPYLEKAQLMLQ